jgi:hypothetical protein
VRLPIPLLLLLPLPLLYMKGRKVYKYSLGRGTPVVMNHLFILLPEPEQPNNPIINQINYLINRTRIPF